MNINFNRKRRDPTREGQMRVKYAPGRRHLSNLKWRFTLLIVLSPFLYFLGKVIFALFVAPASGFVLLDTYQYRTPSQGNVKEVYVEVGEVVKAGTLLAAFENYELAEQIQEVHSQIDSFPRITSEDMATGQYLKDQVRFAREALDHVEKQLSDIDFLFRQGAATFAEYSTAKNQINAAQVRLSSREYEYRQWNDKRAEHLLIEKKDKALQDLEYKLLRLKGEQERLSLRAIYPGQVTEIFISNGQLVNKAEDAITITRQTDPLVLAYIDPKKINRVQSGERANIVLPSGKKIRAIVQHNPGITGRLPSYLSSPMLGRERKIVVYLRPLEVLPSNEIVGGLPVKVYFQTFLTEVLERIF